MVELAGTSDARLDGVFHALADATRRAMLRALDHGERKISDLAQPFAMSFAAASKHVRVLEAAGLVRRRVDGRAHYCRLEAAPMAEAEAWLQHFEARWKAGAGAPIAGCEGGA